MTSERKNLLQTNATREVLINKQIFKDRPRKLQKCHWIQKMVASHMNISFYLCNQRLQLVASRISMKISVRPIFFTYELEIGRATSRDLKSSDTKHRRGDSLPVDLPLTTQWLTFYRHF